MDKNLIVGIDASNLHSGGARTHLQELLRAANPPNHGICEVVVWAGQAILDTIEPRTWLSLVRVPILEHGFIRRALWQQVSLSSAARQAGCDVLFAPGGSYVGSFNPVVTMSRNMLPFEWQELRRFGASPVAARLLLLRRVQAASVRRVDGVIFLTNYARGQVLRVTGEIRGAIRVIPHGVNERFFIAPRQPRWMTVVSEREPIRLLYVSIVNMYKHQWSVVEGVAMVRKSTGLNLTLDLVGPSYPPALQRLKRVIATLDAERKWVNYRGAVPYEQLHKLYEEADIGIFASSCENMPNILLETMAAGLPVVCSDRGPMPEILGNAGEYFDPESPESLANALNNTLEDPWEAYEKAQRSFRRVKTFSWTKCSNETLAFLSEVAATRRQSRE